MKFGEIPHSCSGGDIVKIKLLTDERMDGPQMTMDDVLQRITKAHTELIVLLK